MKFPGSVYNKISIAGVIITLISVAFIAFLFAISILFRADGPYIGLFAYIVVPAFLVIGLLLIPVGMYFKIRHDKKYQKPDTGKKLPYIDFNDKMHRKAAWVFLTTTIFFLILSSVGSYQAYHYTESVSFCGKLCHRVMEPEYSAYQNSPHARVACVECHVGEGASWYVKSKLSGLYQVYSVIFKKYPRPISTPITNLRPARETCEKCHWPQKFYGRKLSMQKNFLADENNTEWDYGLMMKIGPSISAMGLTEGIHWHINPNFRIEYIASTKDRESIPWVKMTNLKTNEVMIFQDQDNLLTKKALDTLLMRIMDCMDCHNRPSHTYKSPSTYVNNALITGEIPTDLPFIKFAAMKYLKENFTSRDVAMRFIEDSITAYYKNTLPDIFKNKKQPIGKAIAGIKNEFNKNNFPYMKVRYEAYPDHIGHLESDGCFRCHSDKHKANNGKIINKNCDLCHTIVIQGKANELQITSVVDKLLFKHPKDIGEDWKNYFCTECHRSLY